MVQDLELFRQIRQVDALFRRMFHTTSDPEDRASQRSRGHGKILHALSSGDSITQKALAERLQIRPQSLTDALDRLEAQGYITRVSSQKDRRERYVQITPAGQERAQELLLLRQAAAEQLFSGLTAEEKEQLQALLQKVLSTETEASGV